MNDYIFIIVGESGAGKTTIVEELEKRYGLTSIQSYTTRPKRHDNETGHIFVSDIEFDQLKDMCAYTEFNGYRYCATSEQVDQNDLYVLDVWGIEYFKNEYKGNKKSKIIYIYTPSEDRKQRMLERGDSEVDSSKRIEHDFIAFANVSKHLDFMVLNDHLDRCVSDVYRYISEYEGEV